VTHNQNFSLYRNQKSPLCINIGLYVCVCVCKLMNTLNKINDLTNRLQVSLHDFFVYLFIQRFFTTCFSCIRPSSSCFYMKH
jgi:hypothetical protein